MKTAFQVIKRCAVLASEVLVICNSATYNCQEIHASLNKVSHIIYNTSVVRQLLFQRISTSRMSKIEGHKPGKPVQRECLERGARQPYICAHKEHLAPAGIPQSAQPNPSPHNPTVWQTLAFQGYLLFPAVTKGQLQIPASLQVVLLDLMSALTGPTAYHSLWLAQDK